RGALDGMCGQSARPNRPGAGDAPLVKKGLLRDWLVLGPFAVKDSVRDLDQECVKGEANLEPSLVVKVDELTWKTASVPADDVTVFSTAELPWLDLAKVVGFKRNQIAY